MTPPGLAIDSTKMALVRSVMAASKVEGSSRVGPHHVPAEILERVGELVDGAAVELARRHELVAGLQQGMHDDHLRGVAGGDGEGRGAALEGRDALLQNRAGRIADARIDVAEGLQAEQRRGVVDVVEHERRRLVDGRGARAGGGVRRGARVDGERVEAGQTVRHGCSWNADPRRRGNGRAFMSPRTRLGQRRGRAPSRVRVHASPPSRSFRPELFPLTRGAGRQGAGSFSFENAGVPASHPAISVRRPPPRRRQGRPVRG